MNDQSNRQNRATVRRVRPSRRPRRRQVFPDTTLTATWPPRLNTGL